MKFSRLLLFALLLTVGMSQAAAKSIQAPKLYIFGFSASFKDSVVYVTDIQELKGAWIDNKTKFLLGRDNYSLQLRDYFTNQRQMPYRVCMVFYATNYKKAERQYLKLLKKYKGTKKNPANYEIHYLSQQEFKFEVIDMSPEQE